MLDSSNQCSPCWELLVRCNAGGRKGRQKQAGWMLRLACCVPCSNLVATLFAHLHSRWSETESAKMRGVVSFRSDEVFSIQDQIWLEGSRQISKQQKEGGM